MSQFSDASGAYSEQHRIQLPGVYLSVLEVADLDPDGHDEIILANLYRLNRKHDPPTGNDVETHSVSPDFYHGSSQGYSTTRRTELPTIGANRVSIGDIDGDSRPDIVFANSAESVSFIYWNGSQRFSAY